MKTDIGASIEQQVCLYVKTPKETQAEETSLSYVNLTKGAYLEHRKNHHTLARTCERIQFKNKQIMPKGLL